jgi:hypothetical protein
MDEVVVCADVVNLKYVVSCSVNLVLAYMMMSSILNPNNSVFWRYLYNKVCTRAELVNVSWR